MSTDLQERKREANRRWRAKNVEYDRARCRIFYEGHKQENTERHRGWIQANRPQANALSRESYHKHKDKHRTSRGQRAARVKYGIDKAAVLAAQNHCCAACGTSNPGSKHGWVVDHDHLSSIVRAILCHHCNVVLGHVRDCPAHLYNLIKYLEKHSAS